MYGVALTVLACLRSGTRADVAWRSDWVELCCFVPMIGQDGEHSGRIDPDGQVTRSWDADQLISSQHLVRIQLFLNDVAKTAARDVMVTSVP